MILTQLAGPAGFVWWYDDGGVCAGLWWRGWCGDIRSHDPAVTPPPGPYHLAYPAFSYPNFSYPIMLDNIFILFIPYHARLYFSLPLGHTPDPPPFQPPSPALTLVPILAVRYLEKRKWQDIFPPRQSIWSADGDRDRPRWSAELLLWK